MQKVHTSDAETRKEFKTRLANKVSEAPNKVAASVLTEPLAPKVKVGIPVNFSELGEAYIHQYLLNSKLTPEQSREICGFLFADQQTETFELEVVITGKQSKPAPETKPEPVQVKTLSLELPHKFNELAVKDQYLWLAKQSKLGLSLEEVNDVIDIVAGNPARSGTGTQYNISFCQYELPVVTYEPSPKKKKANLRPKSKSKPTYALDTEESRTHIDVSLPENFSSLKEYERHAVLINNFQLLADEAAEILKLFKESGETEFTVVRPERAEVEAVPASTPEPIDLVLPYGFLTIKESDKYKYLQTLLPPEQAQEAIAFLNGAPQATNQKFNVSYSKEVEQTGNPIEDYVTRRREMHAKMLQDIEKFASEHPMFKPAQQEALKPESKTIDITLPAEFSSYTKKNQYDYLRFVAKLPADQASDIVAITEGQPQKSIDVFNISYAAPIEQQGDPVKEFISQRVLKAEADARRLEAEKRVFELAHKPKPERVKPEPVPARTMSVSLPRSVTLIDPSQQYLYFTRELKMLPDEAQQLVASFSGMETLIQFKVTLED